MSTYRYSEQIPRVGDFVFDIISQQAFTVGKVNREGLSITPLLAGDMIRFAPQNCILLKSKDGKHGGMI